MDCDIGQVLNEYYKGCAYSLRGNDYSNLKWNERNTIPKPTLEDIQIKWDDTLIIKIGLNTLRKERDDLLIKTDKYALTDWPHASLAKQTEWIEYRQALRDLPTATEDPANPVWPVRPDEVVEEETSNVVVEEETSNVVVEEETSNVVSE